MNESAIRAGLDAYMLDRACARRQPADSAQQPFPKLSMLRNPEAAVVVRSNMSRLDWLIIGGGIHGVHIAARLVGEAGVPAARLRIVDPGAQLLERWRRCTEATGMTHLRSPSVHHLDLNPWSLHQSAGARKRREHGLFAPPYDRPALGFFNEHCDGVIKAFGLDAAHVERAVLAPLGRTPSRLGSRAARRSRPSAWCWR